MTASQYVAAQRLRFGTLVLEPGDLVPLEKGRSYHQMLALGQIRLATAEPATATRLVPPDGARLLFVAHDGEALPVVFKSVQAPGEAERVTLELEPGEQAALVLFDDDPEPALVPLAALLPEQPTQRLIEYLSKRLQSAEAGRVAALAQPSPQQEQEVVALRGDVAFLELLVRAIQTVGEPLADDFPAVKELAGNGVTTKPGALLLAQGEQGKANLVRLDGIGNGRADKILAALFPPAQPEQDSPPTSPPAPPEA